MKSTRFYSILFAALLSYSLSQPASGQENFYRLFGPNSLSIWGTYSPEFNGIYPIDDGDRIAVVWSAFRPDNHIGEVCLQIVSRFGENTFRDYLVVSDSQMINGSSVSTIDSDGNIYICWLSMQPADTSRMYIMAQKISPAGDVLWGLPTEASLVVARNYDWDINYGSTWDVEAIPDGTGGVIVVSNQDIAAFDADGRSREEWRRHGERPPEMYRYRRCVADGIGGLWISWWAEDPTREIFNHLRGDGSRTWEDHQVPQSFFEDLNVTGTFPYGVGVEGGIATVFTRNDTKEVWFLDSLAQPAEGDNQRLILQSGVTIDDLTEISPGVMGIVNEYVTGNNGAIYLTTIDLVNREFLHRRNGMLMAFWGVNNPLNGLTRIGANYLGRLSDGEYLVYASLTYSNNVNKRFIYLADANGNSREEPLVELSSTLYPAVNVRSTLIADPSSGGAWVAGNSPYKYGCFYLNRFSQPWIPISPTGFDPGVPRQGIFSSPLWFDHSGDRQSIFFATNNGFRLLDLNSEGRNIGSLTGKPLLIGSRLGVGSPKAVVGERIVAIWPEPGSEPDQPPIIGAFSSGGDILWSRQAVEQGIWDLTLADIISNPTGDAVVAVLFRQSENGPATYAQLLWIDAASGAEISRFEVSLSARNISDLQRDQKSVFQTVGSATYFSTWYRTDDLIVMKFGPHGEERWEDPIRYELEGNVSRVIVKRNGSIAVCGMFWPNNQMANPWIDILSERGELIETIGVYDHPAQGFDPHWREEDWVFSDDNIWFVPNRPFFLDGPDTSGIQMLDQRWQRSTPMGTVLMDQVNGVFYNWRAESDSVGGIWVFTAPEVGRSPRLFHFTGNGRLADGWPESGVPLSVDLTGESVDIIQSLPRGDVGILTTRTFEYGYDYFYHAQRFSLHEPATIPNHPIVGPFEFRLDPPFPNPFNERLKIGFSLQNKGFTRMTIFDLAGRRVATLFEGVQTAGSHQIEWNAKGVGSGLYFIKLESGSQAKINRAIYLK